MVKPSIMAIRNPSELSENLGNHHHHNRGVSSVSAALHPRCRLVIFRSTSRPNDSQPLNPGKSRAAGPAITSHRDHEARAPSYAAVRADPECLD